VDGPVFRIQGAEAKGLSERSGQVHGLLAETRLHAFAWAPGARKDGGDGARANVGIISQCVTKSKTSRRFIWEVDNIEANGTGPDLNKSGGSHQSTDERYLH